MSEQEHLNFQYYHSQDVRQVNLSALDLNVENHLHPDIEKKDCQQRLLEIKSSRENPQKPPNYRLKFPCLLIAILASPKYEFVHTSRFLCSICARNC